MFQKIMATQLIVRDLDKCAAFYRDILGLQVRETTPDIVSFEIDNVYFFLQTASAAAAMMSEAPLDLRFDGGSRVMFAAGVDDVDAVYEQLKAKGVRVLRPPTDQSWGLRTAYFADPEGNFWEINQAIAS